VTEWDATSVVTVLLKPKSSVGPYSTFELEASFVVQRIVAEEEVIPVTDVSDNSGGTTSAIPEMAVPKDPVQLTSPVPVFVTTCQFAEGASLFPAVAGSENWNTELGATLPPTSSTKEPPEYTVQLGTPEL